MYARRVALFVLKNQEGRVILQHRTKTARRLPNHWAFFGGGIEQNETPEEAVRREAKEELGIDLKDAVFFKRYEFLEKDGVFEKFVFVASLTHLPETLRKQQKEGQNLGLFSLKDAKNLKITNNDLVVLQDLCGK